MAEDISYHLQQLRSIDATHVCGFKHEMTDAVEPVQCPLALKEIRLCCAHSAKNILYQAICALESNGRLSDMQASRLKARISGHAMNLVRLDIGAAQEYSIRMEVQAGHIDSLAPNHEIVVQQRQVLDSLDLIRRELMDLCA